MTGRTRRYVGTARRNQGMVGGHDGLTSARSGSRSLRSSLTHSNWKLFTPIFVVMLLCALFSVPAEADSIDTCHQSIPTQTPVTSVHVQPDDGLQPILDEINFAACTIDLAMYILTNQDVLDALDYAVDRGVRVRVILEKEPFGTFGDQQEMFDRLVAIGAEVRWGPDQYTYSHGKYMVVDSSVLVVTNQNFTNAGFSSNREFGVVTTDPGPVMEATQVFEADWSGSTLSTSFEHLVVSPVNARTTILEMINTSSESVWMYSEVLRDDGVTAALSNAAKRGVDVRILVNPTTGEDDVPYFLEALQHGVQIRVLPDPYVHSKVLIVDGEAALVGSQNYSYTSLDLNREIGIVLTDSLNLERITAVYARDWSRGEPVDTVAIVAGTPAIALTPAALIGRIPCVRWRVV